MRRIRHGPQKAAEPRKLPEEGTAMNKTVLWMQERSDR
jgi:hypothetical protein